MTQSFVDSFLEETVKIANTIDREAIEKTAVGLASMRETGRLFILGVDKQCSSTDEVHGLGDTEPGARAVMAHDFITVSGADHVDATRPNSMGL